MQNTFQATNNWLRDGSTLVRRGYARRAGVCSKAVWLAYTNTFLPRVGKEPAQQPNGRARKYSQ